MTACLCCSSDAGHRYACNKCTNKMRQWLRDLEGYAAIIIATPAPLRATTNGSIGGAYSSRVPARDDAAVILDYRSGAGAAVFRLRDPRDMDDDPIRSLPGSIHGIACWIREEHDESEPARWTLVSELHYLIGKIESCVHAQWINELHDDLRELHAQARAVAGDQPDKPLGTCMNIDCDGDVHRAELTRDGEKEDGARCVTCKRAYFGLDYVRLQAAQEAS
jgi:hypothetical protein